MNNIVDFRNKINELEDRKWNLLLKGAATNPALNAEFHRIDRRLKKLYEWYSNVYIQNAYQKAA